MTGRSEATVGGSSATPWPVLAAVGLATAELGILVGSVPVATGGLILFGGGLSGIVTEAGYVGSQARSMVVVGGLFVIVGGGVWTVRSPSLTLSAITAMPAIDGIARRGLAILVAGCLLVALGTVAGRRSTVEA